MTKKTTIWLAGGIITFCIFISVSFYQNDPEVNPTSNDISIATAIPNDVISFDNASLVEDVGINLLLGHVYETLLEYDAKEQVFIPNLAENWHVSQDGLSYDFDLRSNVTFHDGTPLDAATVVNNINHIQDPESSPVLSQFLSGVKNVEKVDSDTVRFTLTAPSSAFIPKMSFIGIASSQAIHEKILAEHPVGTGPLMFSSYETGAKISFVRNENYWGEKSSFKNLTVFVIPDQSARFIALRDGGIDFLALNHMSVENQDAILKNENFARARIPGNSVDSIYFNEKDSQLSQYIVRRALTQSINTEEVAKILNDSVVPARGPIPISYPENNNTLSIPTFDIEEAKNLYKQVENKVPIELLYPSDNPAYQKMAEYVAQQWQEVGVKVSIRQMDSTSLINAIISGEYQACMSYLGGPYPDPLFFIEYVFTSRGPFAQFLGYHNDGVEMLSKEIRNDIHLDQEKYFQIQQLVMGDQPAIFMTNTQYGYLFNRKKITSIDVDAFLPSKHLEEMLLQK